jgi:ABC transporter substrate binding protein
LRSKKASAHSRSIANWFSISLSAHRPSKRIVSEDPVRLGLVASLARPGGNITGINIFSGELVAKRLDLLRELVPSATRIAVLVNPANVANTATTLRDVEVAAHSRVRLFFYRPHSSSASRFTAGAAGFFILSQLGERPER